MRWATPTLDQIADKIDYGVTASAKPNANGSKFLRITDIQGGVVDWAQVPFCNAPIKKLQSARLETGDIVFARTGATTGKSYLIVEPPEEAVFASYLIRVRPSQKIVPAYLAHFFRTPDYWRQIKAKSQGAAQEGVNATKLASLIIPLPPLDEQRRIAAILDKADSLRQARKKAIALLDSLTQSIFLEMFGDPVSNPKGWPQNCVLSDVANIASGITKGRKLRGAPTRSVPYLAVANVQDKALNLDVVKSIDATESEIERYRLHAGDLLLTEGGDPDKLGRGTIWQGEIDEAIHQNHIFRVRLISKEITPKYTNFLLGSSYGKMYFLKSAKQTTGIASINKTQLSNFPLLRPPLNLQLRFENALNTLTEQRKRLTEFRVEREALFASLQQRAFAGEL